MEIVVNNAEKKFTAQEAEIGKVYLLFKETFAIYLDEEDENHCRQFASFDGVIFHLSPDEEIEPVAAAKVVIDL